MFSATVFEWCDRHFSRVTGSDQEVEIWPFRACAMHPAIINSSFIVDLAMGQISRSTERISIY